MKKWFLITALALGLSDPQLARSASSDWLDLGGGKARLLVKKDPETGRLDGVLEVRLDKGWKTYWKSPGGSGIAPEFDFSASRDAYMENVAFPIPELITLQGASFYGYKDNTAFVLTGMAETPDAGLKLDLLIGVCEEICIPATAQFEITSDQLNRSDPAIEVALALAKSKLPLVASKTLQLTKAVFSEDALRIEGEREADTGMLSVVVSPAGGLNNWVSDPVKLESQGQSFMATVSLPDTVAGGINGETRWDYTILRHDETTGKVSAAIDGQLPITKTKD